MFEWIRNLFGDRNKRELEKLWPIVDEINEHYEMLQDLTDDELRGKTDEFKSILHDAVAEIEAEQEEIRETLRHAPSAREIEIGGDGQPPENHPEALTLDEREALYDELDALDEEWSEIVEDTLNDLLPEAFAVIKETCRRMLGKTWQAGGSKIEWDMVHYDVQLLGGIVLHQGRIAEMKTGEGKTLVATLPLYLNALVGRGAHLVTVNPYLAKRDAEWMGPIFEFHGLTVDCVDKYDPHSKGRREAYQSDITYGTNNEFGFDYLRDNSFVVRPEQLVQREHHFAIIDEIDSVLIDEARTPLIISGPVPDQGNDQFAPLQPPVDKLVQAQRRLVRKLTKEAEDLLAASEEAQEEGNKSEAQDLKDEAGLQLLRATRGFPKNRKLQKLLQEPGVERLRQKTEYFYLQENAKRMPFVDEELYFAIDEKQRTIEMTDKGRQYIGEIMGEDENMFILPDVGGEIAQIEEEYAQKKEERLEELKSKDLSEEKRENKWMNDSREIENKMEEAKRQLYSTYAERAERLHAIEQLLKAYTLYEKGTEYIVQDGKVQIVDEHTGRVMEGRRYSEGLHQALEAKEQVEVQDATQTYATITLQNYFRMYDKLSGMTGTAETEAEEFGEIYDLDVVVVPTNEPVRRDDKDDLVFKTKREKYNAVIDKVQEYHDRGQPVLVGSASVEVSEQISRMLKRAGIRHNVLNAKQDRAKAEAEIVAEAGQQGSVTIATNMAGRGTDIKLGPGVKELGGLAILGSERHESRRIDLQLRGRAGRQGDPGSSLFYLSLEDDLMRIFAGEWVKGILERLGMQEGEAIRSKMVTRRIEAAQKKVEERNFEMRKNLLEYDEVMDEQRKRIYGYRQSILDGYSCKQLVLDMIEEQSEHHIEEFLAPNYGPETFSSFAASKLGMSRPFEPRAFRGADFNEAEKIAKDEAERNAESDIQEKLDENLPEDADPSEWNWEAMARFANSRWGSNLRDRDLKKEGPDKVNERLTDVAHKHIEKVDLSDGAIFLEDDFGIRTAVGWVQDKFGIKLELEEVREMEPPELKALIVERARGMYQSKEAQYPVMAGLMRFSTPGGGGAPRLDREGLVNWAGKRFHTELNYEDYKNKQRDEITELLVERSRRFQQPGEVHRAAVFDRLDREFGDAADDTFVTDCFDSSAKIDETVAWLNQELRDNLTSDEVARKTVADLRNHVNMQLDEMYRPEMRRMERAVLLQIVDTAWKDHLLAMDHLRSSIGLVGYAQLDAKVEYKREGMKLFEEMWETIGGRVTDLIFRMEQLNEDFVGSTWVETEARHDEAGSASAIAREQEEAIRSSQGDSDKKAEPIRNKEQRVGRNDPCPCGSGKKYKLCCAKRGRGAA